MRRRTRSHIFRDETTPPPSPPPPPKKAKRLPPKERPRPKVAYDLVNDVPVSTEEPDFSALPNPLSFEESKAFAYSLYVSRRNWMSGTMFETCWTRKQRGKRLDAGEQAAKDKMSRFGECTLVLGPHTFANTKLFFVKEEEEVEDPPPRPYQPPQPVPAPSTSQAPTMETTAGPQTDSKTESAEKEVSTPDKSAGKSEVPKPDGSKPESKPESEPESKPEEPKETKSESEEFKPESVATLAEADKKEKDDSMEDVQPAASEGPKPDESQESEAKTDETEAKTEEKDAGESSKGSPEASEPAVGKPEDKPASAADGPAGPAGPASSPSAPPASASGSAAPAPGAAQGAPGGPGPPGPTAPRPAPNPVVARLQQMARNDPALAALMRDVATGKASPTSMALFQSYIARARQSEVLQSRRHVRKVIKSVSLAFELEENPSERFLLPRDAVVEVLDDGDILWSFLHTAKVTPPGEDQKEVLMYTPVTVVLRDIPKSVTASVDMCIERYDKVVEKMKKTMEEGTRCDEQYVWYQVDKHDAGIMDEIKRMAPPLLHVPPPKRAPKGRGSADAKDDDDGPARPAAPKAPRVRPTTYPQVSEHQPAPEPTPVPLLRPKLDLPDINSFKFAPGGLPPMPASLAAKLNLPPIPGGPTAPRPPAPAAADTAAPNPGAGSDSVKSEDTK